MNEMATILVVEDDPSTQLVIVVNLEKEGHRVVALSDGARALEQIHRIAPDLLITDIQVPGMDGYDLAKRLREDPQWASLPIILISSLAQRANFRVGMTVGADDYLTKPFSLAELRQAVQTQLKKTTMMHEVQREAVQQAVEVEREKMAARYEKKLHDTVSRQIDDEQETHKLGVPSTVLYTGMKNYLRYSEVLNSEQLGNFMKRYYEAMLDAMQLFGASSVQFYGGAVLAVFNTEDDSISTNKEVRLWRAALAVRQAGQRLKTSFDKRLERMGLPLFETSVAMHTGLVQMIRVGSISEGASHIVPIGDTVNAVREMYKKMQHRWELTASVELVQGLRDVAAVTERTIIYVPPRQSPLDVCQLEEYEEE
jgi:CheY-like chemotaxis protein